MTEEQVDKVLSVAMRQYVENTVENVEASVESEPGIEFSDNFKKRINRLFREEVGSKRAMYPEVDNVYERMRSRVIRAKLVTENKLQKSLKRGNPT